MFNLIVSVYLCVCLCVFMCVCVVCVHVCVCRMCACLCVCVCESIGCYFLCDTVTSTMPLGTESTCNLRDLSPLVLPRTSLAGKYNFVGVSDY